MSGQKQQYLSGVLNTTTNYVDGFVFINSTLQYFPMPEGRVINNGTALVQEFIITDQQGNARISFQDNGHGMAVVRQENSYYAFGLIMPNSPVSPPPVPNKNLYNGGSEWQNDYTNNLPDYYETFYRNYDAALGRWVGVDPKAEATGSLTVYQYSNNNPIMYNDPLGDVSEKFLDDLYHNSVDGEKYINAGGGTFVGDNGNNEYDTEDYQDAGPTGTGHGSVYSVDNNGRIGREGGTGYRPPEGKDILFAKRNGMWDSDQAHIVVNPSDIDLGEIDHKYGADIWNVCNSNGVTPLFIFLARNTNVEWALMIGTNSKLITSHDEGTVKGLMNILADELKTDQQSVSALWHSHPNHTGAPQFVDGFYGPSGFYENDAHSLSNSGDRSAAIWTNRYFPNNRVDFMVYDVTTSQFFDFTGGVMNDESYYNFTGSPQRLYNYPNYPLMAIPK